mgnify:CR=1 FL=1
MRGRGRADGVEGESVTHVIEVGREPGALCYNTLNSKLYCGSPAESLGLLVIDGELIVTTPDHPFFTSMVSGCQRVIWKSAAFSYLSASWL